MWKFEVIPGLRTLKQSKRRIELFQQKRVFISRFMDHRGPNMMSEEMREKRPKIVPYTLSVEIL